MRKLMGLCGAAMLLLTACTAPEVSGGITKGHRGVVCAGSNHHNGSMTVYALCTDGRWTVDTWILSSVADFKKTDE